MKIWFNKKLEQDLSKVASAEAEGLVPDISQAAAAATAAEQAAAAAKSTQRIMAATAAAASASPSAAPQPQEGAKADQQRLRVVTRKPEDIGADHKSLYKEILAGMYDAVLVTDPSGRVIDCNDRATEYFGYAKSELWDQPIESLVHSVNPQLLERLRKAISGNRHVLLDTLYFSKTGESFPAEVAVSGIRLVNDGDLVFFIRNTEKRHRAQQRLRSEHNAIMASPAAFALCSTDGTITFSNPAFADLWGFSSEADVEGSDIREFCSDSTTFGAILETALIGEPWKGELTAAASDGRLFTVAASVAPDRDIHGRVTGIVCSFHEVSK